MFKTKHSDGALLEKYVFLQTENDRRSTKLFANISILDCFAYKAFNSQIFNYFFQEQNRMQRHLVFLSKVLKQFAYWVQI